ncbi:uncharacterized protein I303_105018 [Kwoniella dejecticola CBS 10117]|uniref:Uncharacterized protein n=1 Tax=Kwoniella dejecticola CBS 10117 TaxID=1296121 RepID=A0A1A6A3P5_9TREE|nr:uncharacterized protein I303_05536 [Kwoniella dejecticola CBS 10117]OBR84677.1 hypothetical protein I303_05536 [Kwoniella dejecticola CBS 10117]
MYATSASGGVASDAAWSASSDLDAAVQSRLDQFMEYMRLLPDHDTRQSYGQIQMATDIFETYFRVTLIEKMSAWEESGRQAITYLRSNISRGDPPTWYGRSTDAFENNPCIPCWADYQLTAEGQALLRNRDEFLALLSAAAQQLNAQ